MKRYYAIALVMALTATASMAAPLLTYTPNGDQTIVTASDGATTYWEMAVDTSSPRPGRIMSFFDKSGASDETFSYAFDYGFGSGFIDGMDNGDLRSSGKWSISNLAMTPTEMSYTLSRVATRDLGVATYSMDYVIGLPTITANGYETNVSILDSFLFDENWQGANSDARVRSLMRLTGSADNDEYTTVTHNGYTDGAPSAMIVEATVTDADAAMAAGSTFTQTLTYNLHDGAYDAATATWSTWAGDHLIGMASIGTTGSWAANPGAAGAVRLFTAEVDVDIAIVPEPATMSLLGLGALALIRRRK